MKTTLGVKKQLYERIRSQISDLLGQQDREIKKSERALSRLFSQKWAQAKREKFEKALQKNELVFWGDFHGVRQSQKTVLRWLNHQDETEKVTLALECLPSTSQKWVDKYLTGEISEKDFLEHVKWNRVWGFPWEHYRPLFEWAKNNQGRILVLNKPAKRSTLAQREKWAVDLLAQERKTYPDRKIWVLYGEYHLVPQHFRKRLPRGWKALFVLQNSDRLYFLRSRHKQEEEIFSGPNGYFCLQNVPPWVKWQTYLLFLDLKEDQEIEEGLEVTDHVLGWARILSQELKWDFDENAFNVYTSDDPMLWEKFKKEPAALQLLFENLIHEGLSFVSPKSGWAYLSRISVNEAAALAMQMIYFQQSSQVHWPEKKYHYWEAIIWILAVSYFGSKLINPHRKSPSLQDLQKRARSSLRPFERQAARLVVGYFLRKSVGGTANFFDSTPSNRVRFTAIRWLAFIWGEKLYNAYFQKTLSLDNLKVFLGKNPFDENFEIIFQNLQEILTES